MRNKPEFKQTEIGEIPEEWQLICLKELLSEKGYIRGPFGSSLLRGELKSEGIPVYEQEHAIYNRRTFRYYIDDEKYDTMKRFTVKENDLIISCSGTFGKVSLISKNDPKGIISQALLILRPDTKKIIPEYLKYFFISPFGYQSLASRSIGSVQVNLAKREIIENIFLPLPNLNEQLSITKILSDLDEKIELNNQMNKTLESIAQAIFKQWFVDFEFPGYEKAKFVNGLPEGWLSYTLGDISELSAGGDKPRVSSEKLSSTCTIPIYSNGIDNDGLYGYTNSAKIVDESVTVSARGTIGFTCLRQIPYFPIVRLISLVPNPRYLSAKYLYLWLKNINISGTGTTQQQLTVPDFKKTEILIPTPEIMKQFTIIVDSMFAQITANKNENTTITAIRDSLLPRLMTGKIRVNQKK